MKKFAVILLLILSVTVAACGGDDDADPVVSDRFDTDEIVLIYSVTPDIEHTITITDRQIITDIVSLLAYIEYEPTANAMYYPRFEVRCFVFSEADADGDGDTAEPEPITHWYVGASNIVSGSDLRRGNHLLTSEPIFPDIMRIYNIITGDTAAPADGFWGSF